MPSTLESPPIHTFRGTKVVLDGDLAKLYGVTTKRLLEQVRRNQDRFPDDFCFQLDRQEVADLRSQIATSSGTYGGRRYAPWKRRKRGAAKRGRVLGLSMERRGKPAAGRAAKVLLFSPDRQRRPAVVNARPGPQHVT